PTTMGKKSKTAAVSSTPPTPTAPWIYINDFEDGIPHIGHLHTMLPDSVIVHNRTEPGIIVGPPELLLTHLSSKTEMPLIADNISTSSEGDLTKKLPTVKTLRDSAIKSGCNFVSVNIYEDDGTGTKREDLWEWSPNHLEIKGGADDEESQKAVAEKIYRWLFKALTPHETIHLIPESEMMVRDTESFPDYAYCPINELELHPKNAKVQLVVIVLTRPVVGPDQKLTWSVADRTGVVNFYFQYRDTRSQYTWDWCLALQPGDRKALPRMPMVEVKERKRFAIAKPPFRGIGLAIASVGATMRAVGHGVAKFGSVIKMGTSSHWVPDGDVTEDGKVTDWAQVRDDGQKIPAVVKVYKEKGEKLWKDDDSVTSTEA
ncbi:uncharacterized protein A1O9_13098, partial [Exophiala aquamarina CBS 119918]